MKKSDLELRINELELELSTLKLSGLTKEPGTSGATKHEPVYFGSKFLDIANYINAFIAYVNADTLRYEFVNDLYEKSYGLPKETIIGSQIRDVIGEKNYQLILKYITEVKSGKSVSFETTIDIASGKRWLQVSYSPVFDDKSNIVGIAIVNYDITERKQAEIILKEADEHYRIMFESSPIAINITRGPNIIYANPGYLKLFGFSSLDDLKNIAPLDLFTQEWRSKIQENIQRRSNGFSVPASYEAECFRSDGSKFPILMYLTRTMFSDGMATIAYIIDLTERKMLETKLQESQERYRTIFETANEGIWSMDKEHRIIFVNKQMSDMLGYPPEDLIGRNGEDFMFEEDQNKHQERLEQRRSGFGGNYECRFYRRDGSIIWTQVSATIVKDSNGNFNGSFAMFTDITERRKTEDLRRKSEEKFSKIFRINPEAISINRLSDGRYIDANDACLRKTGFSREEMIGKTSIELNLWADPEDRIKYIHILEKEGKVRNFEMRLRMKSGEIRYFLASTEIIELEDQKYILGHFFDITERKQVEEQLSESKERLQNIFNNLQDVYFEADLNGCFTSVSPSVKSIYGYESPEELIGKHASSLYANPKEREKLVNLLKDSGSVVDYRGEGKKKNGTIFWASMNVQFKHDDFGRIIGTTGVVRDITEHMQIEKALIKAKETAEETENKFRNLFENSPIGKSITGTDGSLHINKAFCEIVGYSEEELLTKKWTEISYPEDMQKSDAMLQSLMNGEKEKVSFEKRYIHKSGKTVWVDISIYLQRDIENKPQFFITAIIDITERKNYENELIKAKEKAEESDRLKSAFLTNMSHEIRTPMNGILGFAELLKEPNLTIEDQQDFIQTIQLSGVRMLSTINSIIDISKIESGLINIAIGETNINEKIEFIYKFFKPEVENKGLQFIYKNGLQTEDAVIRTDNDKVYGVLTNLINNAIKFTYDGLIEFGYVLKSDSEPAELEFFVKDTGIGIPENQQELIFERFRQGSESYNRGYEGSGLGLSIAKSYVEMLGGRIWVESKEGFGSAFYFTLPFNPVSEKITSLKDAVFNNHKDTKIKKLKILVVEDDEISYSLLSRTIQKISKEVLQAKTGVEAVEACRSNPDIDLVLMDIKLPHMNGLEATLQIRQFNKDVIIIAQTAYGFSGDREKAIEAGCNDYIIKPINRTLLFELIQNHCNK